VWKSLLIVVFLYMQVYGEMVQEECEYIIRPLSAEQIDTLQTDVNELAKQHGISIELFKINQNECEFINYEIVVGQIKQTEKNKTFSIASLYPDKKPKVNDYVRIEIPNIDNILQEIDKLVKQEVNKNIEIIYSQVKE